MLSLYARKGIAWEPPNSAQQRIPVCVRALWLSFRSCKDVVRFQVRPMSPNMGSAGRFELATALKSPERHRFRRKARQRRMRPSIRCCDVGR